MWVMKPHIAENGVRNSDLTVIRDFIPFFSSDCEWTSVALQALIESPVCSHQDFADLTEFFDEATASPVKSVGQGWTSCEDLIWMCQCHCHCVFFQWILWWLLCYFCCKVFCVCFCNVFVCVFFFCKEFCVFFQMFFSPDSVIFFFAGLCDLFLQVALCFFCQEVLCFFLLLA